MSLLSENVENVGKSSGKLREFKQKNKVPVRNCRGKKVALIGHGNLRYHFEDLKIVIKQELVF